MIRYGFLLSASLLGCGPSSAAESSGGEGQSDSVAEPKLDVPEEDGTSSSSSSGGDGCTTVVEGDLEVGDDSDFEWLRTVREVQGVLTIAGLTGHTNVEFLGCLESVQGFLVRDTQSLLSLEGLDRLRTIEGEFAVRGNASLETLRGLDSIEAIGQVWIRDNPELSRLELENPTDIGYFRLGWYECDGYGPDATAIPRGDNPKLTGLDGLGQVRMVSGFVIEGQSSFSSTGTIVDVLSRRAPSPSGGLPDIRFHLNPELPQDEIDAVFGALGLGDEFEPTPGVACENQDDDNKCACEAGS